MSIGLKIAKSPRGSRADHDLLVISDAHIPHRAEDIDDAKELGTLASLLQARKLEDLLSAIEDDAWTSVNKVTRLSRRFESGCEDMPRFAEAEPMIGDALGQRWRLTEKAYESLVGRFGDPALCPDTRKSSFYFSCTDLVTRVEIVDALVRLIHGLQHADEEEDGMVDAGWDIRSDGFVYTYNGFTDIKEVARILAKTEGALHARTRSSGPRCVVTVAEDSWRDSAAAAVNHIVSAAGAGMQEGQRRFDKFANSFVSRRGYSDRLALWVDLVLDVCDPVKGTGWELAVCEQCGRGFLARTDRKRAQFCSKYCAKEHSRIGSASMRGSVEDAVRDPRYGMHGACTSLIEVFEIENSKNKVLEPYSIPPERAGGPEAIRAVEKVADAWHLMIDRNHQHVAGGHLLNKIDSVADLARGRGLLASDIEDLIEGIRTPGTDIPLTRVLEVLSENGLGDHVATYKALKAAVDASKGWRDVRKTLTGRPKLVETEDVEIVRAELIDDIASIHALW